MKLLNNQESLNFAPGFDKDAAIWCRSCGEGDNIMEVWKAHIEEHRAIDSIDGIDSYPLDTVVHANEYIYRCTNCGHEESELEMLATENVFEANEAYKIHNNWKDRESYNPYPLIEEEDQSEEDSE